MSCCQEQWATSSKNTAGEQAMCINALTTRSNTRHVIGSKDSTKHDLLLCLTQQLTISLGNKTSAAHP
eukprot:1272599-Ditylum_brightwellii.AAC.1